MAGASREPAFRTRTPRCRRSSSRRAKPTGPPHDRIDEIVEVLAEAAVVDRDGIAARPSFCRSGGNCSALGIDAPPTSTGMTRICRLRARSHFQRDEVLRIDDAPVARGIGDAGPRLADDGEQHIGRGEALLQNLGKVVAWSNLLGVEKDVCLLELALQPVAQAAGVCARIIAPIADENPGHAPPPAGSNATRGARLIVPAIASRCSHGAPAGRVAPTRR